MKSRPFTLFLMAVNLGLAVAVVVLVQKLNRSPAPQALAEMVVPPVNTVTQIAVRKFNATNLLAELSKLNFGWKNVESPDYRLYILNLRSLGCPEETIRDIIVADIAKLYAKRRADIRASAPPRPYWKTLHPGETSYGADPEVRALLLELDREQRQLVRDLLGADYRSEIAKYNSHAGSQEASLPFLTPEKQAEVRSIMEIFDAYEREIQAGAYAGGTLTAEGLESLALLNAQRQEELAAVLTPEELRLYELHTSPLAERLRHDLAGFEPSQEEFDALFNLTSSYEDVLASTLASNPGLSAEAHHQGMIEAQLALETELKRVLGDDRYGQYVQARDPDWKLLTGDMGVSESVASQVYAMKRQAEQQKQRVEFNPQLSASQRQQVLLAIQRETHQSLSRVMGEAAFNTYRKLGGDWIVDLASMPAASADNAPAELPVPPATPAPQPPIQRGPGALPEVIEILVPEPIPAPSPQFPVPQ